MLNKALFPIRTQQKERKKKINSVSQCFGPMNFRLKMVNKIITNHKNLFNSLENHLFICNVLSFLY